MRHPFIEDEEENIRGRIYLIINWKTNLYKSFTFFIERFCLFFFYFFFLHASFFKFTRRNILISVSSSFFFLSRSLVCKKESSMFNFFLFTRGVSRHASNGKEKLQDPSSKIFQGGKKDIIIGINNPTFWFWFQVLDSSSSQKESDCFQIGWSSSIRSKEDWRLNRSDSQYQCRSFHIPIVQARPESSTTICNNTWK